ncbi:MAG: hypothetical protein ABMA26_02300 [Limisphaerales bacterium]
MDFVGIVIFAIVLYVRPQEFIGILDALRPAFMSLAMAGLGIFIRPGGVVLKQVIRTPMDWMVAAYFIYILFWTPGAFGDLWGELYQFIGFYFLVTLALSNFRRLYQYLAWWCGAIMFIAILALLSLIGIDPTDAQTHTAGSLGRLALGLSLFDNPNALGHSVMVAVPLLYYFMIWKRPIFVKEVGAPLIFLPMLCTYFTESKGAFISGVGAIIATLAFGKPKWVQFILLPILIFIGASALPLLPRFTDVQWGDGKARSDEAVLGRIESFEFGKWAQENTEYGVGFKQFVNAFIRKEGDLKARASHSSFNQVAGEFGWWGLLIFSGILYTCYHSLVRARTATDNEERVRRMLFCMVLAYTVSSWMIDFGFRAAFFVMVAMVSAFHRILMDRSPDYQPSTDEQWGGVTGIAETSLAGVAFSQPVLAGASAHDYLAERKVVRGVPTRPRQFLAAQTGIASKRESAPVQTGYVPVIKDMEEMPAGLAPYLPWTKFRWYDAIGIYVTLRIVIYIRDYAITL